MTSDLIFPHQRTSYERLIAMAEAFFSPHWHKLPMTPRWPQLVVAPTGLGKSHVIRTVARNCRVGFLACNFGSWIPIGATRQQGRQTVQTLVDTLIENERTILFVDELDKVAEDTSWTAYLRAELYSILDGSWPSGTQFADETDIRPRHREALARHRLKYHCWIICAGTWQNLWERRHAPSIGFHNQPASTEELTLDELAGTIPRETLNRFSSSVIVMPPMTATDYSAAITTAERTLPEHYQARFSAIATRRVSAAIHNQSGCRFLEESLAQLLIEESAACGSPSNLDLEIE